MGEQQLAEFTNSIGTNKGSWTLVLHSKAPRYPFVNHLPSASLANKPCLSEGIFSLASFSFSDFPMPLLPVLHSKPSCSLFSQLPAVKLFLTIKFINGHVRLLLISGCHGFQDADPVYADLHRFLLSAACQPYLELIQGWLYQQQVDDPYHEFILQQSDALDPATGMKVRM
jgi:hypothetical protein